MRTILLIFVFAVLTIVSGQIFTNIIRPMSMESSLMDHINKSNRALDFIKRSVNVSDVTRMEIAGVITHTRQLMNNCYSDYALDRSYNNFKRCLGNHLGEGLLTITVLESRDNEFHQ